MSLRLSFLGYFVKLPDTADVLGKFKPHTLACLARVDAAQHKIFVVTDGAVEVCVCPLAPGAIRTVRPVDVSTLHSGCRTLSPGSLFLSCGDGNAEIVCVSSAASKVLSLSADSWGDAAAAAPALEEFAKTE